MAEPFTPQPFSHDVIIAGAGMAGATFALAAAQGGLKVVLVDPQPFSAQLAPTFDGRSTAVAYATFRMLDALGVGEALRPHACRMDHILVTDGHRPGAASHRPLPAFLRFDAAEIGDQNGDEPLGYMVENRRIRTALAEAVTEAGIEVRAPVSVASVETDGFGATVTLSDGAVLRAPLVVGAEGRGRSCAAPPGSARSAGAMARAGSWPRCVSAGPTAASPMNISCPAAPSPSCP
jgi:2-octaprenyl-6-methoxyphenol hydroxylase